MPPINRDLGFPIESIGQTDLKPSSLVDVLSQLKANYLNRVKGIYILPDTKYTQNFGSASGAVTSTGSTATATKFPLSPGQIAIRDVPKFDPSTQLGQLSELATHEVAHTRKWIDVNMMGEQALEQSPGLVQELTRFSPYLSGIQQGKYSQASLIPEAAAELWRIAKTMPDTLEALSPALKAIGNSMKGVALPPNIDDVINRYQSPTPEERMADSGGT